MQASLKFKCIPLKYVLKVKKAIIKLNESVRNIYTLGSKDKRKKQFNFYPLR